MNPEQQTSEPVNPQAGKPASKKITNKNPGLQAR